MMVYLLCKCIEGYTLVQKRERIECFISVDGATSEYHTASQSPVD